MMAVSHVSLGNIATFLSQINDVSSAHLYGLVDMGSNGIRFSISDLSPPRSRLLQCVYRERVGISLYDALHGIGSEDKPLYFSNDTIAQVSGLLGRFQEICVALGVPQEQIIVFATEAMRTAKNQDEMLQAIQKFSGFTVTILSHQVESLLGAMGARSEFAQVDGLFLDLGGGSVQITYVNTTMMPNYEIIAAEAAHSLPFGAAKLSAALKDPDSAETVIKELKVRMKASVQDLLERFPQLQAQVDSDEGVCIYLCGGGFRGYGSMLMHTDTIQPYPIPVIGGYTVSGNRFQTWAELLLANQEKTKIYGLSKRRRKQFPAIAKVAEALVEAVQRIKTATFCSGGNREGVLFMKLPPELREADPFLYLPLPVMNQDQTIISSVATLLSKVLPRSHPVIFTPSLLNYVAQHIWIYLGLKENASRALNQSISSAKFAFPGLNHETCAILALIISARWGSDLGPVDSQISSNLQKIIGVDMACWCQYIGTACKFLGMIFPVIPKDSGSLQQALQWEAIPSNSLGKDGNKKGIELRINLDKSVCKLLYGRMIEEDLKKIWKKVGKHLGHSLRVEAKIKFMN